MSETTVHKVAAGADKYRKLLDDRVRLRRERDEAVEMVRRLVDSLEPEHYVEPDPEHCETCAALADAREVLDGFDS